MENTMMRPGEKMEILIVEDSPTQAERLKFILEQRDYAVLVANNGRQALENLATQQPGLLNSDVVMPEMDGYQFCNALKADSRTEKLPVILLTSLTDPVDVIKGMECGADNFIFKPYDENYLLTRITYFLANKNLRESELTRMGVEVYFAGRKFFITSDRLQILNLLLSTYEAAVNKNRELSAARDELRHLNLSLEHKVRERTASLEAEVTERKRAEAQVRELNSTLEQRIRRANATVGERQPGIWRRSATPFPTT